MRLGEIWSDRLARGERMIDIAKSYDPPLTWEQVRGEVRSFREGRGENQNTVRLRERLMGVASEAPPNLPRETEKVGEADRLREVWREYLGTTAIVPGSFPVAVGQRRVVVLADLHGMPSPDILRAVISQKPERIVIAGDLLDSAQVSPWGKAVGEMDKPKTLRQEMAAVRAFIEQLLMSTRADIDVMRGNHDIWSMRQAAQLLPAELLEFFRDPFDVLLEGLPGRVHRVRTAVDYVYPDHSRAVLGESEFVFPLADALISHANFVGSNAGDAVRKLALWYDKWRQTLGLGEMALYIQAHVHSVALIEHDGGSRVLIEPGASCDPSQESYKIGYKSAWKPMSLGCAAFTQIERGSRWLTDRSSIELIRPRRGVLWD